MPNKAVTGGRCPPYSLNAIKAGDKYLVISIKNYQPPGKNSAGFVASLLSGSKARRIEVMRFGVHPDTAFVAGRKNPPQRFLMPLKDYAGDITGDQICVEVGFFLAAQLRREEKPWSSWKSPTPQNDTLPHQRPTAYVFG